MLVLVYTIQPVDREKMPLFRHVHQNFLPSAVHELRFKHKSQKFWRLANFREAVTFGHPKIGSEVFFKTEWVKDILL